MLANPGRGEFASLPAPNSRYDALELSLARLAGSDLPFALSYVLSRKYGNYVGVRDQDSGNPNAHAAQVSSSTGLLPNDRTHSFKALASYRLSRAMTIGATFAAQSGTPTSEFALVATDPLTLYFLSERGVAGRTPALWDLGFRGTFDIRRLPQRADARLVVDVLHAFSRQTAVRVDQIHYLTTDADGTPRNPNPFYQKGLQFQPPMTLRIGVEVGRRAVDDER